MLQNAIAIVLVLFCFWTTNDKTIGMVSATQPCSLARGQQLIDAGEYKAAIRMFTCLIDMQPTEIEGYRGRIEAQLLLGRYADAVRDYTRVTALVLPLHPDVAESILADYTARLKRAPNDIPALTGASFARWWFFDYAQAIHLLNHLLDVQPENGYGTLFRGSSRLLLGAAKKKGVADLEHAISLAPQSADVRFIVADAYTYGLPDPARALAEASLALDWGLDTPRIHAILASAHLALGDPAAAAAHLQRHIELVTSELLTADPLTAGTLLTLDLVPGRTYEIPVPATAGETLSIRTSSPDFYDSILVLLAPNGTPVTGGDDYDDYFAGFDWVAEESGSYRLQVTSFESVSSGALVVERVAKSKK